MTMENAAATPEVLAVLQQSAVTAEEFDYAVEQASLKAATLTKIVEQGNLYTMIGSGNNKKKHLQVEAWQTIAMGYGLTARIESTSEVEGGGWEARAIVVNSSGAVVGSADGEAGTRGDGVWVTRPSYSQRSMAQTRAISRGLRGLLAWVVVLGGYSPTPAEEMTSDMAVDGGSDTRRITEKQQGRLFTIASAMNYQDTMMKAILHDHYGLTSSGDLNRTQYDELVEYIKNTPPPEMPEGAAKPGMSYILSTQQPVTVEQAMDPNAWPAEQAYAWPAEQA